MENSVYRVAASPPRRRGLGLGGFLVVAMVALLFGAMGYIYIDVKARQHDLAKACADTESRMEELRTEITVLRRERGELLAVSHLERRLREEGSELQAIRPSQVRVLPTPELQVGAPDAATRDRLAYREEYELSETEEVAR